MAAPEAGHRMGTFHSNIQVRALSREAVVDAVRLTGLKPAFVVGQPPWMGVYAELLDTQDTEVLEAACRSLSARLEGPAFGFLVHDSDVFLFFFHEGGRRRDLYNSRPGYFQGKREKPSGGDVKALLLFAVPGTSEAQLHRLLHELRASPGGPRVWASPVETLPILRRLLVKGILWAFTATSGPPAECLLADFAALMGIPQVQALSSFKDLQDDAAHHQDSI